MLDLTIDTASYVPCIAASFFLSRQKFFEMAVPQVGDLLVILVCCELFSDVDMLDILSTIYIRRDS